MAGTYAIPGYFENCVIKGDRVVENRFLGKVLFEYKNHTLKEPGFLGKTVLVFKRDGIFEPGFAGKRLFNVSKYGEVKETGLFGRTVGAIPTQWVYDAPLPPKEESPSNSSEETHVDTRAQDERELREYKEELDESLGYVADYTNCKPETKKITVPAKYSKLTAIAPALKSVETVVIHAGVLQVSQQSIHCSKAYVVDENNPKFKSIDGVLYNKEVTTVVSVPSGIDLTTYRFPETVTTIMENAISCLLDVFFIQKNIRNPGNISAKKGFEIEDGNTYLKIADNILYSSDGKILYSAPKKLKLSRLVVPDGVETIKAKAFSSAKVEQIILPNGVKEIMSNAFIDSSLNKIFIPSSVEVIGDWAFYRTKGLTIECQAEQKGPHWSEKWAHYDFDMYKPIIIFGLPNPDF